MDRKLMRKFSLAMRQEVLTLAQHDAGPDATFENITERAEAYLKWIDADKRLTQNENYEILVRARVYGLTTKEVLRNATQTRTWLTSAEAEA